MSTTRIWLALAGSLIVSAAQAAPDAVAGLTLARALELAEQHHPRLAEVRALREAQAGRAAQAGVWPNPEAILGAQQLGAAGQEEYVAGVAQSLPLGGRLDRARAAEAAGLEAQERRLEAVRGEVARDVRGAFATALYQEEALRLRDRIAQDLEQALAITRARVAAGDARPEELAAAEIEQRRAALERDRCRALSDRSRATLGAAVGRAGLTINSVAGALDEVFAVPALEVLARDLGEHPEARAAEAEARAAEARAAWAVAERIPDVTVEALYHRLEADGENTVDVGLSVPLPLFDRGRGRVRAAQAEARAAEARAAGTRLELEGRLRAAHADLQAALRSREVIQAEILPRAERVRKGAEARYAAGDLGLAEVLPVRRDWALAQLDGLEALREVMAAWSELVALLPEPRRE